MEKSKDRLKSLRFKKILPKWMVAAVDGSSSLATQMFSVIKQPFSCLKSYPGDALHVTLSIILVMLFLLLEVFQLRFGFPDEKVTALPLALYITLAVITVPISLLFCYLLPYVMLPIKKRNSWQISIFILLIAHLLTFLFIYQISNKSVFDYSEGADWPIPLIIGKDCLTFFVFAVLLVSNTWNHVHALRVHSFLKKTVDRKREIKKSIIPFLPTVVLQLPLPTYIIAVSF